MRQRILQFIVRHLDSSLVVRLGRVYAPVYSFLKYGDPWFAQQVVIETGEECNRKCWYCPNSTQPKRTRQMTPEMFSLALDRLKEIRWSGPVYYGLYSEPLMDEQLEQKIVETRVKLPGSLPRLFSNGDFLTEQRAQSLITAGLVWCRITRHEPTNQRQTELVKGIVQRHPETFKLAGPIVNPNNRGGLIEGLPPNVGPCHMPTAVLSIDIDGNVLLCCADYSRVTQFGNIRHQSIMEIWQGERFSRIRSELRNGVRSLDICKKCNA